MSGVQQVVFQNQRSFGAPPGQQAYTSPGTYTWVAPAGVTVVSVVAVGAGAGGSSADAGSGGGLGYKNNISVAAGSSYTVVVGTGGVGKQAVPINSGTASYFISCTGYATGNPGRWTGSATAGGTYVGDGGGNGG
jgi:hypothetical protein